MGREGFDPHPRVASDKVMLLPNRRLLVVSWQASKTSSTFLSLLLPFTPSPSSKVRLSQLHSGPYSFTRCLYKTASFFSSLTLQLVRAPLVGRTSRAPSFQHVRRSLFHTPLPRQSPSRWYAHADPVLPSLLCPLCTRGRPITLDEISWRTALFSVWPLTPLASKGSVMEWPIPIGNFNISDGTR